MSNCGNATIEDIVKLNDVMEKVPGCHRVDPTGTKQTLNGPKQMWDTFYVDNMGFSWGAFRSQTFMQNIEWISTALGY